MSDNTENTDPFAPYFKGGGGDNDTALVTVDLLKKHGLFASPLNNGDWMVGRASRIYSLDVADDHYADETLCVAPSLILAITGWLFQQARQGES